MRQALSIEPFEMSRWRFAADAVSLCEALGQGRLVTPLVLRVSVGGLIPLVPTNTLCSVMDYSREVGIESVTRAELAQPGLRF
jgi:hypothetical protein